VLAAAAEGCGAKVHRGGTYVCIEGPAFSTRAESQLYRSWGVDVIGMTNYQEARLAREAEICYATMALVTDYDCWHESEAAVSVEMLIENLHANAELAQRTIKAAVPAIPPQRTCPCATALKNAILTRADKIPPETKKRLDEIIGKYVE
jgi:5'-methylthioadenosine phosphorylase